MRRINATKFHRKSGGAERRDLQFSGPLVEMLIGPRKLANSNRASKNACYAIRG
jgi:hypothetical protein